MNLKKIDLLRAKMLKFDGECHVCGHNMHSNLFPETIKEWNQAEELSIYCRWCYSKHTFIELAGMIVLVDLEFGRRPIIKLIQEKKDETQY